MPFVELYCFEKKKKHSVSQPEEPKSWHINDRACVLS